MIRALSLPLVVTSGTSLLFGVFFLLLYLRLKAREPSSAHHHLVFSLLALVNAGFLGAFATLLNSEQHLVRLDIANRIVVISASFTVLLAVHFYASFFQYRPPVPLGWCYLVNVVFTLACLAPNRYFLAHQPFRTSRYYTGLAFGPAFRLWGLWIIALSLYGILLLFLIYRRTRNRTEKQPTGAISSLIAATAVWLVTGIGDALTAVQVVDLPPLTWVGSFLVTGCIAWILVLQIDNLHRERHELHGKLIRDHLTGAYSRGFFEVRLAEGIGALKRGASPGLCVCVLDVDGFKTVNDRFGHAAGDRVLRGIVETVTASIRASDCCARLGGDEFALLFPGVHAEAIASFVVERIRARIASRDFSSGAESITTSCSFGLVCVGPAQSSRGDLAEELMIVADAALYESKHRGKNSVTPGRLRETAQQQPATS